MDEIYQNIGALYGTFNINMEPVNIIDVTKNINELTEGDNITISKEIVFSELFGAIEPGERKYLQIKVNENIYNIAEDQYPDNITIRLLDKIKHLKIVYYLYINPNSNWRGVVSGQLLQLKSYGILAEADLYIHITDCYGLAPKVEELIREIVPAAIISFNYENQYEYPGIKLVYDLAKSYPEDNFIYFHAKGMSRNVHSRDTEEVTLFTMTFKDWRKNIQRFNQNGIQKIGLFPAVLHEKAAKYGDVGGWVWYNYWYATGKYLSNCPEPEITTDRYYYEGWLGKNDQGETYITNDCMSLYKIKKLNKQYFTPTEADYHLNLIPKQTLKFSKRAIQVLGSSFAAHCYFRARLFFNK